MRRLKEGNPLNAKVLLLGGLAALPGFAPAQPHSHGEVRSAQVQAALEEAVARVPAPRYERLRETPQPGKNKRVAGTLLEVDGALQQSVVVVIDEAGVAHTECVEGAAPQEAQ